MIAKIAMAGALLAMTGCAQIGHFGVGDAGQAAVIDPAHADCYKAWGLFFGGQTGITQPGVLTAVASAEAARSTFQTPSCAQVNADVALALARIGSLGAIP